MQHPVIRISVLTDSLIRDLEMAAMEVGEVCGPVATEVAYSHLTHARSALYAHLSRREVLMRVEQPITKRF